MRPGHGVSVRKRPAAEDVERGTGARIFSSFNLTEEVELYRRRSHRVLLHRLMFSE